MFTPWFVVVVLLMLGTLGMGAWMVVAAWQGRNQWNERAECDEIRTSIAGRCVALSPARKEPR